MIRRLAALVLSVIVIGCGGDDGDSAASLASSTTAASVQETTSTSDPVEADRDAIVAFWRAGSGAGKLSRDALLDFLVGQAHPIFEKASADIRPTRANCQAFLPQDRFGWQQEWVVDQDTIEADPTWSPPFAPGEKPEGRVYAMTVQSTVGGATTTSEVHAAVMPDGNVTSFLFCPQNP